MKVKDFKARCNAAEHAKYTALVMGAWERLNPGEKQAKRVGKPSTLDTDPDVRRKAKSAL